VPIARIPVGQRVFAPAWLTTAVTVALCIVFVGLGRWQWQRGNIRQAQWDAFARGSGAARVLGSADIRSVPRFQRITVTGRFDAQHQFLLDNRTHAGRAGYEVLTPFELADGRELMIDRGWVAFTGYRAVLPDIHLGALEQLTLTGRVVDVAPGGLAFGRVPPDSGPSWPKVTSYPTMAQLGTALGRSVEPRIVLLDSGQPNGYVREWQAPGLPPLRHWSYAIQWWGFAAALLVIWVVLSTPKARVTA
jgi:surfeit locus 1 family protein